MRRPDLPLILLVLAVGFALAVFADDERPVEDPQEEAIAAPENSPDPVDDFFANFDPVFADCFGDVEQEAEADSAAGDPKAIVDRVSRQVEELRELEFERKVKARFLGPKELRTEVEGMLEKEIPVALLRKEEQVLELLGAIPPQDDLVEIVTDAYGSQVAGLYDTESKEFLVQASDEIDADELVTVAHELDHALVDQALELLERAGDPEEADRELAYSALVEGDATLLMELYLLKYVGTEDQLDLGEEVPGEDEFDSLPDYAQRNLLFPYLDGLRFVCHQYADGGWPAVNRAFARPPAATSQVIFPDRYKVLEPFKAELPPRPGPGWESVTHRELGAAELEWLFQAPGGDPAAALPDTRKLVFGWAGGELELWKRGSERALAISLVQLPDTNTLCGAMSEWYRAGWPEAEVVTEDEGPLEAEFSTPDGYAALNCDGLEVRMGLAPDRATASSLAM